MGAGPLPGSGPKWFFLAQAGSGSAAAKAATVSLGFEGRSDRYEEERGSCDATAITGLNDITTVTTSKGSAAVTLGRLTTEFPAGGAIWQLNERLTSYSLRVQFLPGVLPGGRRITYDESEAVKTVDHCAGDKVSNETKSRTLDMKGITFSVQDMAIPANSGTTVKGSKTIPWTLLEGTTTATAEWTIRRLK
jgi:hypothetical protein